MRLIIIIWFKSSHVGIYFSYSLFYLCYDMLIHKCKCFCCVFQSVCLFLFNYLICFWKSWLVYFVLNGVLFWSSHSTMAWKKQYQRRWEYDYAQRWTQVLCWHPLCRISPKFQKWCFRIYTDFCREQRKQTKAVSAVSLNKLV